MPNRPLTLPRIIPLYPLREQVAFPQMVFPLFVPPGDLPVIEEAMRSDRLLGVFALPDTEPPWHFEQLAKIGTLCRVNQLFRFPEGGGKVVVEGLQRIRLLAASQQIPFFTGRIEPVRETEIRGLVAEALVQSVNALLKIAIAYGRPLPGDALKMIDQIGEAGHLADLVTVYLGLDQKRQQQLLETFDPLERLKEVYLLLTAEVQKLQVRGEVQTEVTRKVNKTQKDYLLREQLKEIQDELGEEDPRQGEAGELRARIARAGMPENVRTVAEKELLRLQHINPASPEYTVSHSYLDCLCTIPWNRGTEDNLDICQAQQVLDADHFNLKQVKERILEYLAVRSLKKSPKGPILCFVGPPGVGKTSLGRSIARALGRRFIRISLGGMKDEAEIRGHRRTYIGALPGRIIQEICRVAANNPVFMLDEIDKIGQDFRGDPASALLEVLDPEQNHSFTDHYLDLPFDLSKVMFITTANVIDPIPFPLRDRMETIHLSGYSDEEKKQIACKYLIPKQLQENGLGSRPLAFGNEAVLKIIRDYTREAGVRGLERQLAAICRKIAREIAQAAPSRLQVTPADVEELLGPRKFFIDVAGEQDRVGVATGVAWTESGGDILFIEASRMSGKKELLLTGSLGEVMQESAKAALSFVRAHAADFGIESDFFEKSDIHIHVPGGAIPKDGPSAGVTIAAALISLFTGRPARRDVAMTGELTLSGRILPIGGVKEKVLAARRAGVTTILLPARNREHLQAVNKEVRQGIEVILVDSLTEVVEATLLPPVSLTGQLLLAPAQRPLRPEPNAGASPLIRL